LSSQFARPDFGGAQSLLASEAKYFSLQQQATAALASTRNEDELILVPPRLHHSESICSDTLVTEKLGGGGGEEKQQKVKSTVRGKELFVVSKLPSGDYVAEIERWPFEKYKMKANEPVYVSSVVSPLNFHVQGCKLEKVIASISEKLESHYSET